jgi:hypothetical protein
MPNTSGERFEKQSPELIYLCTYTSCLHAFLSIEMDVLDGRDATVTRR